MNYMNALMDPGQLGQGVYNAFQMGLESRRQSETMNALSAYAKNQSPEAAGEVARHDPMMGIQLQDREAERQAAAQKEQELRYKQELQQRAAQGDPTALAELAGIDINAWNTIGDQEKQGIKQRVEFIGQAALAVSQLPEAQRPQAWDSYVMQGAQMFPELAQYRGQYSPEALNSALAQAGLVKQFIELERPSYQVIPEGGTMVNTRDPGAVAQFGAPPPPQRTVGDALTFTDFQNLSRELTPQGAAQFLARSGTPVQITNENEYNAIPPGVEYIDPNGQRRSKR